jgi:hypothetical protein
MTDARIFINYRRGDSAGWAGRLHDDLADRFGRDRVFRDVGMSPGVPFREHIDAVLDRCAVVIAVIGPQWETITNADGYRRLDDPRDLVRREIVRALQRQDVQVIPVLVDGARMPAESDLPQDLAPLTWINACELSDSRWDYDVDRLEAELGSTIGPERHAERHRRETPSRVAPAAVAAAALGAVIASPITHAFHRKDPSHAPHVVDRLGTGLERAGSYGAERGVLWAIVVALVLTTGALVARPTRRGAVWPALVGLAVGALAGALGGAVYIALKDGLNGDHNEPILHAVSVGVTGLAIGLLAGALTGWLFSEPHTPLRGLVLEAFIVVGAIAAALATLETGRGAAPSDEPLPASSPLVR